MTELRERGVVDQREASRRSRVSELVADCPVVIARLDGHALVGGGCYERELFATADKNEGIDAFLTGRDPEWRDR